MPLIDIVNLHVRFNGKNHAVDGISVSLEAGETLGIVGESGSGKSALSRALLGLLPKETADVRGNALFEGQDLIALDEPALDRVRGRRIAMIFQEPATSLNPILTIGYQIVEVLRRHEGMSAPDARMRAIDLLRQVRIADPERRIDQYPHELSGGMRQRAMIAIALACRPALLLADEPTTALDVTVQAQVLALMRELKASTGMAIILVTHNLGVINQVADNVLVMYAGAAVEYADRRSLMRNPRHPYTQGLLAAIPRVGGMQGKLHAIPGMMPPGHARPTGCRFHPRCAVRLSICGEQDPPMFKLDDTHRVACWLVQPDAGGTAA